MIWYGDHGVPRVKFVVPKNLPRCRARKPLGYYSPSSDCVSFGGDWYGGCQRIDGDIVRFVFCIFGNVNYMNYMNIHRLPWILGDHRIVAFTGHGHGGNIVEKTQRWPRFPWIFAWSNHQLWRGNKRLIFWVRNHTETRYSRGFEHRHRSTKVSLAASARRHRIHILKKSKTSCFSKATWK